MELLSWVEEAAITYRLSISFRKVVSRGEIGEILFALTSTLFTNLILEFFSELVRCWRKKILFKYTDDNFRKKKKNNGKFGKIWENYR